MSPGAIALAAKLSSAGTVVAAHQHCEYGDH